MLKTLLRPMALIATALTLLTGGLRLTYGLTTTVSPFDLFVECDGALCWQQIQPGSTSIFEAETLLRDAGFDNLASFGDQMVEAGLALATSMPGTFENDTYITTDYDLTVTNMAFTRQICSHDVLAAWGRPDAIMAFRYRDYRYMYLYHTDGGHTVMFRSEEANSYFSAAELMSTWAFERYNRMTFNNYDEVPWNSVEQRLGQPC
ncbi:MAG: hypothetical protein AAFR56_07280 [Chloroflexota bacterium]